MMFLIMKHLLIRETLEQSEVEETIACNRVSCEFLTPNKMRRFSDKWHHICSAQNFGLLWKKGMKGIALFQVEFIFLVQITSGGFSPNQSRHYKQSAKSPKYCHLNLKRNQSQLKTTHEYLLSQKPFTKLPSMYNLSVNG